MSRLLDLHTALEPRGPGRWGRKLEEGVFWGVATPHGGYTMALLLHAMQCEIGDPARRPRAFAQQFLGRIAPGEVEIEVRIERAGRAVTSVTARLHSAGDTPALASALFTLDREGPTFLDDPLPDVAPPHAPDEGMLGFGPPVHGHFEFHRRFGSGGAALPVEDGGWIVAHDPGPWDHRLALVASDLWVPPIVRHPGRVAPTPSLHHVVHFGPDVQGPAEMPLLVRHRLSSGASGLTEEDIALWSADGRLLLTARQLRTVVALERIQGG